MPPRRREQPPRAGIACSSSTTILPAPPEDEARGATKVARNSVPSDAAAAAAAGEPKEDASQSEVKGKRPPRAGIARRSPFEPIWSGADEVRILESLAAYVEKHHFLPIRSQLEDAVKGHLVDKKTFSLTQIYEKVRLLKNRYMKLRAAHGGAPPPGVDAEKLRKYELSDMIWGKSLAAIKKEASDEAHASQTEGSDEAHARRGFEELGGIYPHLALNVEQISAPNLVCLKKAFEFIDDDTARELDVKLKKQRVLELKTEMKRDRVHGVVLRSLLKYVD